MSERSEKKLKKEKQQMSLKEINYHGWTEIFMHPVPRGIPIHETAAEVTREINVARDYLETQLRDG